MRAQNFDDHTLASLIAAVKWELEATETSSTNVIGKVLEQALMQSLTFTEKSADDVFKFYK